MLSFALTCGIDFNAYQQKRVNDKLLLFSFGIMQKIEAMGAEAGYYDPHVKIILPNRQYGHYAGIKSIEWNKN